MCWTAHAVVDVCRVLLWFAQNNIAESTLKKLKKYIDNPKFIPETVEKTSKVWE